MGVILCLSPHNICLDYVPYFLWINRNGEIEIFYFQDILPKALLNFKVKYLIPKILISYPIMYYCVVIKCSLVTTFFYFLDILIIIVPYCIYKRSVSCEYFHLFSCCCIQQPYCSLRFPVTINSSL